MTEEERLSYFFDFGNESRSQSRSVHQLIPFIEFEKYFQTSPILPNSIYIYIFFKSE